MTTGVNARAKDSSRRATGSASARHAGCGFHLMASGNRRTPHRHWRNQWHTIDATRASVTPDVVYSIARSGSHTQCRRSTRPFRASFTKTASQTLQTPARTSAELQNVNRKTLTEIQVPFSDVPFSSSTRRPSGHGTRLEGMTICDYCRLRFQPKLASAAMPDPSSRRTDGSGAGVFPTPELKSNE